MNAEAVAEAMLSKRWRKEPWCSLALRDQLNERRDTKPLQGASAKSRGLERCRKRRRNLRQVCTTKTSESEPSDDASKSSLMTSEPGSRLCPGMSLAGCLVPGQAVSGVKGA